MQLGGELHNWEPEPGAGLSRFRCALEHVPFRSPPLLFCIERAGFCLCDLASGRRDDRAGHAANTGRRHCAFWNRRRNGPNGVGCLVGGRGRRL